MKGSWRWYYYERTVQWVVKYSRPPWWQRWQIKNQSALLFRFLHFRICATRHGCFHLCSSIVHSKRIYFFSEILFVVLLYIQMVYLYRFSLCSYRSLLHNGRASNNAVWRKIPWIWSNTSKTTHFSVLAYPDETLFPVFDILPQIQGIFRIFASQTVNKLEKFIAKSSPNFMVFSITHPNLLYGSDFLCFLFMNYYRVWGLSFQKHLLYHYTRKTRRDTSRSSHFIKLTVFPFLLDCYIMWQKRYWTLFYSLSYMITLQDEKFCLQSVKILHFLLRQKLI